MKLKVTQPGMEGYTGILGEVRFEDGVSISPVSKIQAQRIRSAFKVETEDGEDPSIVAEIARAKSKEAPLVYVEPIQESKGNKLVCDYTQESLMAIADKSGLAGLREFAEPYGVKSNSIIGLIQKLMELKIGSPDNVEDLG